MFFFQILLPVRHGDLWIIYVCHNGATGTAIPNFMSFREKENDPSARKAQRKLIIEALGKALRRRNRSSPFDHRDFKRITYREEFKQWLDDNIAHRVGLLSMYFLENFSGTDFNVSIGPHPHFSYCVNAVHDPFNAPSLAWKAWTSTISQCWNTLSSTQKTRRRQTSRRNIGWTEAWNEA